MITAAQARMDLSIATGSLAGHIEAIDPVAFSRRQFADRWSAAEITEHLLLLDRLVLGIINGPAVAAGRPADAQVGDVATFFENRGTTLQSPESIVPTGNETDKNILLEAFKNSRSALFQACTELDMDLLCTGFTNRAFGQLTRLEWIYFIIYHGDRHLHQVLQLNVPAAR